jgi:AMIN domain
MAMKCFFTRRFHLIACVLTIEVVAGFSAPLQTSSASSAQVTGTETGRSPEAVAVSSPTTIVSHAVVLRENKKTIVLVITNGTAVCQVTRLSDPERVVMDFQRARLATPATIPSSYFPVLRIRAGQFKQDVARVVIDLQIVKPYRINLQGNTVTVEFDEGNPESVPRPTASLTPSSRDSGTPRSTIGGPAVKNGEGRMLTTEPSTPTAAPPVGHAPIRSEPVSGEPSFTNGMLTFHVQNQSLRSAVMRIGIQSDIAITMGENLGTEPVSVEFRNCRIDEALRQMLTDYDTFFLYSGDDGNKKATSLKAVWVYPEGQGQEFYLSRDN